MVKKWLCWINVCSIHSSVWRFHAPTPCVKTSTIYIYKTTQTKQVISFWHTGIATMYCVRAQKTTQLLPNKLIYLIIDPFLTAGAKGIFLVMPFRALEIFSTYKVFQRTWHMGGTSTSWNEQWIQNTVFLVLILLLT